MNTTAASTMNFVRYVAQYPATTPQVVFRRLKVMGVFLGLGVIGVAVTLTLIGLEVPANEPERLLTAFGFAAAVVVIIAALFSAGLLLWGGFISQYVQSMDSKAEVAETHEMAADVAAAEDVALAEIVENVGREPMEHESIATVEAAVKANDAIVRTVTCDTAAVVEALEQAIGDAQPKEVRELRRQWELLTERMKQMERSLSPAAQRRLFANLQPTCFRIYTRGSKTPMTEEEKRHLVAQILAADHAL